MADRSPRTKRFWIVLAIGVRALTLAFLYFVKVIPVESLGTASSLIYALSKENWTEASEFFDPSKKEDMSADKLAQLWNDLVEKHGDFKEIESLHVETAAGHPLVLVSCEFKRNNDIQFIIIIKPEGQVMRFDVVVVGTPDENLP